MGSYGNNSSGAEYPTTYFGVRDINTTNSFVMTITNMSGNMWALTGNVMGTATYTGSGIGYVNAGGTLDRISIFPDTTTWVSGTLYVTYE